MAVVERKLETEYQAPEVKHTPLYTHDADYSLSRIEGLKKVSTLLGIPISIEILANQGDMYTLTKKTPDGNHTFTENYIVETGKRRVKLNICGNHRLLFFGLQTLDECTDEANLLDESAFFQKVQEWTLEDNLPKGLNSSNSQ